MRHAARIASLENKNKSTWNVHWHGSRRHVGPEIKVIEIWEVSREFGEDGTEHVTETLIETMNLNRHDPEETRKED